VRCTLAGFTLSCSGNSRSLQLRAGTLLQLMNDEGHQNASRHKEYDVAAPLARVRAIWPLCEKHRRENGSETIRDDRRPQSRYCGCAEHGEYEGQEWHLRAHDRHQCIANGGGDHDERNCDTVSERDALVRDERSDDDRSVLLGQPAIP
jgi:hypothetical protein